MITVERSVSQGLIALSDGAATLAFAGVTAWNALIVQGQLKPGETVVIIGTGGVVLFAFQLANFRQR